MLYNSSFLHVMELTSVGGSVDILTLPLNDPLNKENPGYMQHVETSKLAAQVDPPSAETFHQEAYYLFFVGAVGLILNLLVIIVILVRRNIKKLTSAFLIHACFIDFVKAAYCIPIANNLLTQVKPAKCDAFGATYVLVVTASMFNLLAMVCTEAYTFGEDNIGGDSRGSICCILFGMLLVYIATIILHLGPTLIGGYFEFHNQIGSCSFVLGQKTGYVANIMWILIITFSIAVIIHFICKLYQEIQVNHTNRVSMLVRSSITLADDPFSSMCNVEHLVNDAIHRAKIFILSIITFVICFYPLFLLFIVDVDFLVSPKVYQAFSFIAWSHGTVQPMVYICFDRHVNLLATYVYCDRYRRYRLTNLPVWAAHVQHARELPQSATQQTYDRENEWDENQCAFPRSNNEESVTISVGISRENSPPSFQSTSNSSRGNEPEGEQDPGNEHVSGSEYPQLPPEMTDSSADDLDSNISSQRSEMTQLKDTELPTQESYHNLSRSQFMHSGKSESIQNLKHSDQSRNTHSHHKTTSIKNIVC